MALNACLTFCDGYRREDPSALLRSLARACISSTPTRVLVRTRSCGGMTCAVTATILGRKSCVKPASLSGTQCRGRAEATTESMTLRRAAARSLRAARTLLSMRCYHREHGFTPPGALDPIKGDVHVAQCRHKKRSSDSEMISEETCDYRDNSSPYNRRAKQP